MKRVVLLLTYSLIALGLYAQSNCGAKNTAFQAGEELGFTLYFNWKFVWIRVSSAQFNISRTTLQQNKR